jgi:hypothetical protein
VSIKEIPEASKSQVSSFKINITAIVFKTDEGTLKELVLGILDEQFSIYDIHQIK